jgi:acetyltransferase-like isoleucine patch superfamily enzyme
MWHIFCDNKSEIVVINPKNIVETNPIKYNHLSTYYLNCNQNSIKMFRQSRNFSVLINPRFSVDWAALAIGTKHAKIHSSCHIGKTPTISEDNFVHWVHSTGTIRGNSAFVFARANKATAGCLPAP